jgi:hypothetical protein
VKTVKTKRLPEKFKVKEVKNVNKIKRYVVSYVLAVLAAFGLIAPGTSSAVTIWDPIVTAANVDGLSTMQITLLAAIILLPLGLAGFRVVKGALGYVGGKR